MRRDRGSWKTLSALLMSGLLLSASLMARDLEGSSEWGKRAVLSTSVSGMVSKVHKVVGDEVEQGTLLLALDTRGHQARQIAAKARLEASRQLNDEARRELDRTLELYDRTLISEHERKLAEIAMAESDAALHEAEAKLITIRLQREYSRVKAPFSGLVLAVHVQPGQAVINRNEASPLVTLVDHRQMQARVFIDASELRGLNKGDPVKIGVRGRWLDGTLSGWGYEPAQADGGAGYRLEASFSPDPEMRLRAGEPLVIRLPDE